MTNSFSNAEPGKLKVGFILSRAFTLSAFALFVDTLRLASDEFDRSGRVYADWQVLGSTGISLRRAAEFRSHRHRASSIPASSTTS